MVMTKSFSLMWLEQNEIEWTCSGGAFGVERVGAAQHRRRCRSGCGWVVAVFGAGGQDAFDGAVVRITDRQCSGAGRVQAGIAVVSRSRMIPWMARNRWMALTRRELGDDRDRARADLFGLVRHHVTLRRVWAILCGG